MMGAMSYLVDWDGQLPARVELLDGIRKLLAGTNTTDRGNVLELAL